MKIQIRNYAPTWTLLPESSSRSMRRDAKHLALQRACLCWQFPYGFPFVNTRHPRKL